MWYLGSKNRISKELVPIIQSYVDNSKGYIEPFVGGANMIDKIKCDNKYGSDNHKQLIALLQHIQTTTDDIPLHISEEEYIKVRDNKEQYEDWYVGLVGFCATFGAKYFGGYARSKADKYNGEKSEMAIKNLLKQAPNLKGIHFECKDFREIKDIQGYTIYCDIPYKNATKYKTKEFPYEEFYDWCREMSKDNFLLVSEYNMPNDFKCIWEKETKTNFDSNRTNASKRVEKLFKYDN